MMPASIATGTSQSHLVNHDGFMMHHGIVADFQKLKLAAQKDGITLTIASSFRDFERQQRIWNNKFNGKTPVYDKAQNIVDLSPLNELETCHAIMLYSAMPGASRHHFGTDLDVFDSSKVPKDYRLQLSPQEYSAQGPFAELSLWLEENAEKYGFFRPYRHDLGGVAVEPWHISHITQSQAVFEQGTIEAIKHCLSRSEVAGRSALIANLPALYKRYVANITQPNSHR